MENLKIEVSFKEMKRIFADRLYLSEEASYEKVYEYLTKSGKPLELTTSLMRTLPWDFFDFIYADKKIEISKGTFVIFNIKYKRFQFKIKRSLFGNSIIYKDYKHSDIRSYELVVDDEIIITNKQGVGKALAGGLLFGGAGAIAGALSSNTSTKKTNNKKYTFKLYLEDFDLPYVELPCENREKAFLLIETFKMWEEKISIK